MLHDLYNTKEPLIAVMAGYGQRAGEGRTKCKRETFRSIHNGLDTVRCSHRNVRRDQRGGAPRKAKVDHVTIESIRQEARWEEAALGSAKGDVRGAWTKF